MWCLQHFWGHGKPGPRTFSVCLQENHQTLDKTVRWLPFTFPNFILWLGQLMIEVLLSGWAAPVAPSLKDKMAPWSLRVGAGSVAALCVWHPQEGCWSSWSVGPSEVLSGNQVPRLSQEVEMLSLGCFPTLTQCELSRRNKEELSG